MWKAFCSVVMPVMTPAVIAGTIISLSYAWNEFILAMVLTKNMRTLPVNLYLFITDMGVEWGSLTAAAFLSICTHIDYLLRVAEIFHPRAYGWNKHRNVITNQGCRQLTAQGAHLVVCLSESLMSNDRT